MRQKPVAALVYKRGGAGTLPVIPPMHAIIPDPPELKTDHAWGVWQDFWTQPTSGLVNLKRDRERLRFWIRAVDERENLWELWSKEYVVEGANGGPVSNPLFSQIVRLTAAIERAEQAFGMTPLAKMRLTGALDVAEKAEDSIKLRREGRAPKEIG